MPIRCKVPLEGFEPSKDRFLKPLAVPVYIIHRGNFDQSDSNRILLCLDRRATITPSDPSNSYYLK
jgi:hypothetical protein